MENIIGSRLKEYIDKKGLSIRAFESLVGFGNGTIQKVIKGDKNIGSDGLSKMFDKFPDLDPAWLFGKESHFHGVSHTEKSPKRGVPYYGDVWATAGLIEGIMDAKEEAISYIEAPGLEMCDAAIQVVGDSMVTKFESGDVILIKKSDKRHIVWGSAYLVVTSDLRTVTLLYPGERQEEVKLVSTNGTYPPFSVAIDDILHLFIVKGRVQRLNM